MFFLSIFVANTCPPTLFFHVKLFVLNKILKRLKKRGILKATDKRYCPNQE